MNMHEVNGIGEILSANAYPGRGIVVGKTEDGTKAAVAYFIMGRSENSRNRVFALRNGELYTQPFDASKVEDPSLIIYTAVKTHGSKLIVTNGDQTDTICDFLSEGKTFEEALDTRCFEPDSPNFTPRISAELSFSERDFGYKMSILKSADKEGAACSRYTFSYPAVPGLGHFIHTYACDGNPLPSFLGEPEALTVPNSIDEFAGTIWQALNEQNKISLYVRYVSLTDNSAEERLINKNKEQ